MLHGLITVILLVITNKLGVILRLFVFVSVGFDLLVIASLFLFRFRLMGRKRCRCNGWPCKIFEIMQSLVCWPCKMFYA